MSNDADLAMAAREAAFCRAADQLYEPSARRLIGRLCRSLLDHLKITPTELLSQPEYQKFFLGTGTAYQTAVQKVAVAQVQGTKLGVNARVLEIYAIVDALVLRTNAWFAAHPPQRITPATFVEFIATARHAEPPALRDHIINSALTMYLGGAKSYGEKIDRLLALGGAAADASAYPYLDALFGELVDGGTTLKDIFGAKGNLAAYIEAIVDLLTGAAASSAPDNTLTRLARQLANAPMPATAGALVVKLQKALTVTRPLASESVELELQAQFKLLARIDAAEARLGGEPTRTLLEKRMARMLSPEALRTVLQSTPQIDEQFKRLLQFYGAVRDSTLRLQLRRYMDYLFEHQKLPQRMAKELGAPIQKLRRIAHLHRLLAEAKLLEVQRSKYAAPLEAAQADIIREVRLFERVESEARNPADPAIKLIELCVAGIFTPGPNLQAAHRRLDGYLHRPDFQSSYLAGFDDPAAKERKLTELRDKLTAIGLAL
jgi:hypothetical protein